MKSDSFLLELMRSALWGCAFKTSIADVDFCEVMRLAEEQTVLGIALDGLSGIGNLKLAEGSKEQMTLFESIGGVEQIKQQNESINEELSWFYEQMNKRNIACIVVKGQTNGALYPKPELRQSGDIDFLTTKIAQLVQVFPDEGIPERIPEKEYAFSHNEITYELHSRLIDFGCKKHQKLWAEQETREWHKKYFVKVDGVEVRTLSPTMNAAYLYVHLFFHLIREGVSLRQFCDWAVCLHHYKDVIDRRQLAELMERLDMQNGYRAFGCIVVDELGLPENEFPMPLNEDDRRWKERILHDVFSGGNFGRQNHKAKSALGFKMETLCMAIRNTFRYYPLAPSEMRMMIPKMIGINMKLLLN